MKLLLSTIILAVTNVIAFHAQPGNDDCTSPITLCANQAQSGNTQDATISVCIGCSDGATAAGNFCFALENTVWFSFTTNSTGGDAQIDRIVERASEIRGSPVLPNHVYTFLPND